MKSHQFTELMTTPHGAGYIPPPKRFEVTQGFITNNKKEITNFQKRRLKVKADFSSI